MTGMGSHEGSSRPRRSWLGIVGAALLVASGAIHLDLYLTGYRTIPTIGPLFLLQVIAAFVLAAAILVTGNWLVAAAGAGFAVSVLGGYLLSLWVGLFGFTEVRTTAGIVAGIIDVAAFATLAMAAAPGLPPNLNLGRRLLPAVAGASVVALALLFAAVATPKSQPLATGPDVLKARTIGGVNLLTDSQGAHPVLVRPGHLDQIGLLRQLRRLLAPGDRDPVGRARRHRHARHHHPDRRHQAGHLRRPSAVHLHRRQRTRLGQRQQHQPERRPVARRAHHAIMA